VARRRVFADRLLQVRLEGGEPVAFGGRQVKSIFAQTMADRQEWEHATAHSRSLAVAADAELRRRHPDLKIEPLHSAEPVPVSDIDRDQLTPTPGQKIGEMAAWIRDLTATSLAFGEKIEERQGLMVPSEDPNWGDLGEALPAWRMPGRDAILQAPKPQITPSVRILQLTQERDTEPEAAD
jgi:hypothetical protein